MTNLTIIHTYKEAIRMERSKTVKKEETRAKYTQLANDCEEVLEIRELKRYENSMFEKLYDERRKNW